MIKTCFKLLLGGLLYLGLQQLIELKTHGFCLQRILSPDLMYQPRWETPPLSPEAQKEICQILQQPFHMIGAGSECFAFLSADGNTVIKFFKLDHLRPVYLHRGLLLEDHSQYAGALSSHPLLNTHLPSFVETAKNRLFGMREWRILRTFNSIHLAYTSLKEQTGLLYLHLNPGGSFPSLLTLYDGCGIAHQVDLHTTRFVLQRRATPLLSHFALLVAQERESEAQASIDSLIHLLLDRCQKGISDRDIISRNFGYIDNQAIEIDAGSFSPMQTMKQPWLYRQELLYATLDLKRWLEAQAPHLARYLEQQVDDKVS